MSAVGVIARLTLREAGRRRILWVGLILSLVFLLIYYFGYSSIFGDLSRVSRAQQSQVLNFLSLAGLYAVNFLVTMMTVLASVDTVSGEIASGTIHTLLSKPVRRAEVLLGKWFGFAAILSLYLGLMAGGVLFIGLLVSGYVPPNVQNGVALLWLNCLMLLTISLLGGTALSTLANGVLVFGLYGVAFIGGWVESIGALLQNQTAVQIGILSSLIVPSEALWKRAAFEMQTALAGLISFSPFTTPSVPSPAMIAYAGLYTLVALALAVRLFDRRDL